MFRFPSKGGSRRNRSSGAETRLYSATRNPETTWRAGWAQLLRGLASKVRSWVSSSPPPSSSRRKRCLLCVEELDNRIVPSGFPPTANGDMYYLVHDHTLTTLAGNPSSPGLLDNDSNPNGDTLRVSAVAGQEANVGAPMLLASGATITVAADGSFQYIPPANWGGTDEFSYTAANGAGSSTATATINVTPPDYPPSLTLNVTYGSGRTVTLYGTVTDEQPGGLIVTFTGVVYGQTTTNAGGSYSYTAEATGLGEIRAETRDNAGWFSDWVYITLTSNKPQIVDFQAVAGYPGWTIFQGRVLDESAAGLTVTFGGQVAVLQGRTATVGADGTFWIAVEVPASQGSGQVTATVTDWWGLQSDVAVCWYIGQTF